jgi:ferric-dicitrate binding protein FerR (iron transport regulator)
VAVRDAATGWADGRVMIANGTVRSSLPVFRRWYQYDLRPETKLLDRPVSLSAPVTSGDSALAELERVAHVKQIWLQKNMVLVDASSPAARAK